MSGATVKTDVLNGRDARDFVSKVSMDFSKSELKDILIKANDNDFLLVTKRIGSKITILDVKKVDDALISSMTS